MFLLWMDVTLTYDQISPVADRTDIDDDSWSEAGILKPLCRCHVVAPRYVLYVVLKCFNFFFQKRFYVAYLIFIWEKALLSKYQIYNMDMNISLTGTNMYRLIIKQSQFSDIWLAAMYSDRTGAKPEALTSEIRLSDVSIEEIPVQ